MIDAAVLVTARSFALRSALEGAVREVRYNDLGRPLTAAELRERLDGVEGVLAGLDEIDASVLGTPGLRVVARHGVGVDRVDLSAAERHGVTVTNTPGANAAAVAELTLTLMLLLCRPVRQAERAVGSGEWPVLSGSELGARTVGLLGAGQVGSRVKRVLMALGCTVLVHDPAREDSLPLDELLPQTEILSLHAPLTAGTRGMVGEGVLGRLPRGALLVNTARGELVDEAALVRALDSGRLAGAALDALAEEPPPPGHPLIGRDDLIVTSHIGGHTAEARAAMGRTAMEDLLAVLDGRPPLHPVVAA